MAELRKCPFCGSENLYIIHDKISIKKKTFVECQDCKATAPIEAWNNRATEAEIRASALDEFAEKLIAEIESFSSAPVFQNKIEQVAEQLKGE